MNTRGTYELLKIALNCKNLLAFLHISTAYINPFESYIEEKVEYMNKNLVIFYEFNIYFILNFSVMSVSS